jgi:hypothetical protein
MEHVIVIALSLSLTHKNNTKMMTTLKHIAIHLGVLFFVNAFMHQITPIIFEAVAQHGVLSNSRDFILFQKRFEQKYVVRPLQLKKAS